TSYIQGWLNNLGDRVGKATANRHFNNLRACLNWGVKQGHINLEVNPCDAVTVFKLEGRDRYLKPGAEFQRLKASLLVEAKENKLEGQDAADVVWLLMLTGARKSNVLSMEWSEIDLARKVWIVPASKEKSGHTVVRSLLP